MAVVFRLLGPFTVEIDGRVVPITGPSQQAVLGYLALRPGQIVLRDELLPLVPSANSLASTVRWLRLKLGSSLIETTATGYVLAVSPDAVDALRMSALAARAAAERDPALLAEALGMWQEPSLGSPVVLAELRALREAVLHVRIGSPVFQLPAPLRTFVGRSAEIARVVSLLDKPFVAITGPAGVGKTALAVTVAHQVRSRFPDGQLYANLRGQAVLPRFLRALGVATEKVPVEHADQLALFRSLLVGKRILIVLDNAESVPDLVTPGSTVIVTSRAALPGGVALDVLSEDESVSLLAGIAGSRVSDEPEASLALARLCGRLPLALCVSAANLATQPHLSVASFVASLDDPFDLAYEALPVDAQVLFRRLSLVPGPDFTDDIAACLAGSAAALPLLVDARLVESHAPGRFRLHDLLRAYAAERCRFDEPDAHAAWLRMLDFLVLAANDASSTIHNELVFLPQPDRDPSLPMLSFAAQVDAVTWLEVELPNLLAVVREVAERGPLVVASQLAIALHSCFSARMQMAEWIEVSRLALEAAQRDDDPLSVGRNHLLLSDAYWNLCQLGRSEIHLEFAEASPIDEIRSIGMNHRGRLLLSVGRLSEAIPVFEAGISLARSLGHGTGVVIETCLLGDVYWERGLLAEARSLQLRGLANARSIGYRLGSRIALARLAQVLQALGSAREAMPLYEEALELARSVGHVYDEAITLMHLGSAWRDLGRYSDALACARSALEIATGESTLRTQAGAHHVVGSTLLLMGENPVPSLELGLSLAVRASLPRTQGDCLVSLASATGDLSLASRAVELCPEHGLIRAAALKLTG